MMLPRSQVKVFASTDVVDMRFGFDRLAPTSTTSGLTRSQYANNSTATGCRLSS